MRATLLPLVACLLLPATAPGRAGDDPAAAIASMTAAEATRVAEEVIPVVEAIRGRGFKNKVPVRVVDDAAARAHFQARIDALLPPDQMRAEQTAYEHLGLLPKGIDLREMLFELLEEQAGGYYDPATETFYLLGDMPRGIISILMAHELTHALDDQLFSIDGSLAGILADEDATDAFAAVVEGSGTLVMSLFLIRQMAAGEIDLAALLEFQKSEAGRAEKLRGAPQVLQRAMLGPYILGQTFLLRGNPLGMLGGIEVEDVDRAFRDPPRSFEQILHPEKYWDEAKRDDPRPVALPDVAAILGEGWRVQAQGTLGELDLAVLTGAPAVNPESPAALTSSSWTTEAATGWGGDRWLLLSDGTRNVTVFASLWDSEEDARQFTAAAQLADGVRLAFRRDAVLLIGGDSTDGAEALVTAALDALAPAPAE